MRFVSRFLMQAACAIALVASVPMARARVTAQFGTPYGERAPLHASAAIETARTMVRAYLTDGGAPGYGMCWNIGADKQGRPTISHGGGGGVGGTSDLLMYPDARIVVAIQANLTGANFGDLAARIARAFMK
jgi:CubicO group peptidase (beta-lactamase class C family)